jgi:CheY-like chemotaxis protein
MGVEICLGINSASRMLKRRRFDAVILECEADGKGLEVLQELRSDHSNKDTIAVGVVEDKAAMDAALATGANFVLAKPISVEDASRILRFTQGMISRMVRRFLRIAVHHLSHVDIQGMKDPAFILDLSEGGMAMQSLAPMEEHQQVALSFLLPGTSTRIETKAQVVWVDPTGRIGLEFSELTGEDRQSLKGWVLERNGSVASEKEPGLLQGLVTISVLSQWMKPLARVIDGIFVSVAAAVFCLVSFLILRSELQMAFPLAKAFGCALFLGAMLYGSLFALLDVRFPGTRAMQALLTMASSRQTG